MHRITNAVFADYFTTLVSLGMLDFLSCLLGVNSLKLTALTLITVPARTLSSHPSDGRNRYYDRPLIIVLLSVS